MDNNQQPTSEQKIKRAKLILWLGIAVIIIIGLIVAVYRYTRYTIYTIQSDVNTVANSNITKNQNTNTLINSGSYTKVSISEVLKNPYFYKDQLICLSGYFSSSFEFMAMGSSYTVSEDGREGLSSVGDFNDNLVWIDISVPKDKLECDKGDTTYGSCFGELIACGLFKVADISKEKLGFGHLGRYRYALQPESWK